MDKKTISEILLDLKKKKYSTYELTCHYLDRIEKLNPLLNAFITITKDEAIEQAKLIDQTIKNKEYLPLMGIPIAHKDIFCTKNIKTTCGSHMLDNFISPYNATLVQKLSDAGTVLLGKTNMDEFAMGSSNENSHFGPVKNPWDLECVPGGSSGGSAAAVAANLVVGSTGTDTGGSIRQPAALCGISGLKPTYGLISRFGMIAYASSLDQAGPMAKSVEDVALLMNHMAGFDVSDSTSVNRKIPDYTKKITTPITNLKIGIVNELLDKISNSAVLKLCQDFADKLASLGVSLVDNINLPHSSLAIPVYYVISPAECSSNLARFDGVRYGFRTKNAKNLNDLYEKTRGEGFGCEVKRRIMTGTYTLSSGFYDAYYLKAQKIRRLICQDYLNAFEEVDAIICPTSPTPAFKIGEKINDPVNMYLSDIFTISVNLAGLPALSIPMGFVDNKPVGMQIIGKHFSEELLLNIGHLYQQHSDWHTRTPNLNTQNLKD